MPVQCTCEQCGKSFTAKPYRIKAGQSRFCSLACYHTPRAGIWQGDGTVLVPLTRGHFAVIDEEDAEAVLAHNWCARVNKATSNTIYAAKNDGGKTTTLHNFIFGECGQLIDHIDRNGLNNRRRNLRCVTPQESVVNRERVAPTRSGFRGVTLHKPSGRWHASITCNRKVHSLRYHDTPELAAAAYDTACRELFGDFCVPNFPDHERHS